MVDFELKRDRVTIRCRGNKWEWIIEPRYWRNSILWVTLLLIFPAVAYFISPGLINTLISANLLAAIAMPMSLMTLGTGRVNFGPNFFVGVGGYTAALLSIAYGWGPLATLPFAIIITLVTALLYSPLVIVARGLYYVCCYPCFCLLFFLKLPLSIPISLRGIPDSSESNLLSTWGMPELISWLLLISP